MEAEQLGTATRDITISAEISIYLPCEGVRSNENDPEVRRPKSAAEGGFASRAQLSATTHLRTSPETISSIPSKNRLASNSRSFCTCGSKWLGRWIGPAIKWGNKLMKRA